MSDWADDDSPGEGRELAREWSFRREQHFNVGLLRLLVPVVRDWR